MTERISLTVDGHPIAAAFAKGRGPVGVVVLHEFWGLTPQISGVTARLSEMGFPALAVDLYDGTIAANRDEASRLMNGLDRSRALRIVAEGARELRRRGCSKVAVLGFCMGGALSLASAAGVPDLDGAVVFYGIPDGLDAGQLRVPMILHFANTDAWCTPERVDRLERDLTAAGARFELFRYDAHHAFCNETRTEVYSPACAQQAFERTRTFLSALGGRS